MQMQVLLTVLVVAEEAGVVLVDRRVHWHERHYHVTEMKNLGELVSFF
jgi:hypothetical protein